ncbi:SGNH/GDSL hydrolase family protein [Spirosoma sp. SC4-14]|uniref:SGNH/GDSL hydrolase family protein n=1 Tax=Spirosoma sp. SC4-14 TaxID=3128900 RepID=UPI0030D00DC4
MKKGLFLLLIFLLLAQSVFAQTLAPRTVESQSTKGYTDLRSMFEAEGKRNGWTLSIPTATTSGTILAGVGSANGVPGWVRYRVAVSLAFTSVPKGKAVLILGGNISCTKQAAGSYFLDNNLLNTNYPQFAYDNSAWACVAGGRYDVPAGGVVRFSSQLLNPSITEITEPWSSTVAPVISSTATVEYGVKAGINWLEVTDDLNYSAEYVIDVVGDSKLAGTGPTSMNTMLAFLMRNYYASKGYNVRVRNLSVGGVTAYQQEYRLNSGGFNFPVKSCLGLIDLSTNDVLTSTVADSTGKRNARIASFLQAQNPGSFWAVFTTGPLQNTTSEAAAVVTSASITSAINALANAKIKVVSGIRSAFSATNTNYYAGDGVHWSDLGNSAEWAVLKAFLDINLPNLPKPVIR